MTTSNKNTTISGISKSIAYMLGSVCIFTFLGTTLLSQPVDAQYLNQVKLRGNATRVELDYWDLYPSSVVVESRVWLYETGAGFSQSSWFTCPTGSCVNPSNLLGCQCRLDMTDPNSQTISCSPILISSTSHSSGHKEAWECPDLLYKHGNCLSMTGYINYEGGDLVRPFMVYLAMVDQSRCE